MVKDVYEVAKKIQELKLPASQPIFDEGEPGESAYIVKSGTVAVFTVRDGQKKLLAKINTGGIIGEMALIDDGIRLASAMALTDIVLIVVTKAVFQDKLNSCDPFIRALLKIFIEQIRAQQSSIE